MSAGTVIRRSPRTGSGAAATGGAMKFEDAGRELDRELASLRKFLDREIKPATRRDMARLLRKAADRLAKLAKNLEKSEG